jgi:hypothetical protein
MLLNVHEDDARKLMSQIEQLLSTRYGPSTLRLEDGSTNEWVGVERKKGKYTVNRNNVLSRRLAYVNSGAVFVEAEVGGNPGTEVYVNKIRKTEVRKSKAAAKRLDAEATAIKAGKVVLPSSAERLTLYLAPGSEKLMLRVEPEQESADEASKGSVGTGTSS